MSRTILIVDDDRELCDLVGELLRGEGFEVEAHHSGAGAVEQAASGRYALVILDVMLPEQNGFEILRPCDSARPVPVILLTARGEDVDRIVGLEIGADDYLPKPFNSRELTARIHAVLRRIQPREQDALPASTVGDVTLDPATRTVTKDDLAIDLTTVEFDLLHMLLDTAGRVVTREDISQRVLGRGVRSVRPEHRCPHREGAPEARRPAERRRTHQDAFAEWDTSMRSLAIKIFLSFWMAQVVILVGLEIFRPRTPRRLPRDRRAVAHVHSNAGARRRRSSSRLAVCFLLARHLASPLKRVRDASERLASGDLEARAGALVQRRRDEIGDLVRDFDVMAERLQLLVSSQKQLLSDISHELRSPLARLQVAVELARRKAGPDAEKDLNRIEAEGTRMNEMIGQILTLARADSDRPAVTEQFDLADIVRPVAADTDYEARQTGREVRVRDSEEAHCAGRRGAARQRRSRTSCETAAATRRPAPRSTSLSTPRPPTRASSFGTTAPACRPEKIERIFLPFHRVSASRDRNSGGTGLGLSIAARAANVHGGTIHAGQRRRRRTGSHDRSSALQSFTFAFRFLTARRLQRLHLVVSNHHWRKDMQEHERRLAPPKRSAKAGIGRREALALIGATGAAFAAACASDSPTAPSSIAEATTTTTTTGSATGTGVGLRRDTQRNRRAVSVAVDLFRSDIRENKSGTQLDLTTHRREHRHQLCAAGGSQRRNLAMRCERQLLAVRKRAGADLPARHPDD